MCVSVWIPHSFSPQRCILFVPDVVVFLLDFLYPEVTTVHLNSLVYVNFPLVFVRCMLFLTSRWSQSSWCSNRPQLCVRVSASTTSTTSVFWRFCVMLQVEQDLQVSYHPDHRSVWQHLVHGGHRHPRLPAHWYVYVFVWNLLLSATWEYTLMLSKFRVK